MVLGALLEVENRKYRLIECEYGFFQRVNEIGLPCCCTLNEPIRFTIASPDNNDMFFHEWMLGKTEVKNGTITFSGYFDGRPSLKTLNFENTYCIGLHEHFIAQDDTQMLMHIALSGGEFTFGEKPKTRATRVEKEERQREPKVTGMYWMDEKEENKIETIKKGQTGVLYVETEDFEAGEDITISLLNDETGEEVTLNGTVEADLAKIQWKYNT